ncbi:MAG TPA: PEP-CTERM sorting domain-containing protein [Fibrobacteria bacterium]|nr:PEP-CTERM sorting domain-containing protein [Fibrobacteria bacterium]
MSIRNFFATLLAAGTLASVHAIPVVGDIVSFSDTVRPSSAVYLTTNASQGATSHTYSHSILDEGYEPGKYEILRAAIYIDVYDDGPNDGSERVKVVLDNINYVSNQEVDYRVLPFIINTKYIQQEGLLTVKLVARNGDFLFRASRLDVDAVVVPEPGTMALFGAGLLGLGFLARRRRA